MVAAILAIGFSAYTVQSANSNMSARYWGNTGNGIYVELPGPPDYDKCGETDLYACILMSDDETVPEQFTEQERIDNGYDVQVDPLASEAIYD